MFINMEAQSEEQSNVVDTQKENKLIKTRMTLRRFKAKEPRHSINRFAYAKITIAAHVHDYATLCCRD